MADNVGYSPGTGATVAADEISAVLFQRIKLIHGADGTNAGDVSTTNGLPVQAGSPTSPTNDYQTASVAAGATGTLTTAAADGKKLTGVEVWAEVAYRVAIHTLDNAVESTNPLAVGGGQAYQPFIFRPPHKDYIALGTTAGLDAFRAKVTNMDTTNTITVYVTFHFES